MILTLKLPGLAFEINSAATALDDDIQGTNSDALKKIDFMDVIHYSFGYMGVLTGKIQWINPTQHIIAQKYNNTVILQITMKYYGNLREILHFVIYHNINVISILYYNMTHMILQYYCNIV